MTVHIVLREALGLSTAPRRTATTHQRELAPILRSDVFGLIGPRFLDAGKRPEFLAVV